jgi:hypothetical protein
MWKELDHEEELERYLSKKLNNDLVHDCVSKCRIINEKLENLQDSYNKDKGKMLLSCLPHTNHGEAITTFDNSIGTAVLCYFDFLKQQE